MSEHSTHDQLRRLLEATLLAGQVDCVHNLFLAIAHKAKHVGVEFDGAVVLEHFWHLARIGAVAVPGAAIQTLPFPMPQILLTAPCRKLLETASTLLMTPIGT